MLVSSYSGRHSICKSAGDSNFGFLKIEKDSSDEIQFCLQHERATIVSHIDAKSSYLLEQL